MVTKVAKPIGRPKIPAEAEQAIRDRLNAGMGMLKAAREVGVGTSAAQRVKDELSGQPGKSYWHSRPDSQRKPKDTTLRAKYGISVEDFESMWQVQKGLCFTCDTPMDGPRDTHVDHDHTTGRVRTLLCNRCNVALGLARENPETLRRLSLYAAASRVDRERS